MHKLFISGFPLDTSELDLARMVGPYGDIDTIKIVYDRKTRVCKGYAFIEMKTAEGAQNAIAELDGAAMGDRVLTLNLTEEKPPAPPVKRFNPQGARPYGNSRPPADEPAGGLRPKRPRRTM